MKSPIFSCRGVCLDMVVGNLVAFCVAGATSQHLSLVTTSQFTTCRHITFLRTPHHTTSRDFLHHRIQRATTRRNGSRMARTKTSVLALHWLVTLCTSYRQILSLAYSLFPFETSFPGLPGSTCIRSFSHL